MEMTNLDAQKILELVRVGFNAYLQKPVEEFNLETAVVREAIQLELVRQPGEDYPTYRERLGRTLPRLTMLYVFSRHPQPSEGHVDTKGWNLADLWLRIGSQWEVDGVQLQSDRGFQDLCAVSAILNIFESEENAAVLCQYYWAINSAAFSDYLPVLMISYGAPQPYDPPQIIQVLLRNGIDDIRTLKGLTDVFRDGAYQAGVRAVDRQIIAMCLPLSSGGEYALTDAFANAGKNPGGNFAQIMDALIMIIEKGEPKDVLQKALEDADLIMQILGEINSRFANGFTVGNIDVNEILASFHVE